MSRVREKMGKFLPGVGVRGFTTPLGREQSGGIIGGGGHKDTANSWAKLAEPFIARALPKRRLPPGGCANGLRKSKSHGPTFPGRQQAKMEAFQGDSNRAQGLTECANYQFLNALTCPGRQGSPCSESSVERSSPSHETKCHGDA